MDSQVIDMPSAQVAVNPALSASFSRDDLLPAGTAPSRKPTQFGRLRRASQDAVEILSHKVTEVSSDPRMHWRALIGEFIGTTMFIFLVLALNVNSVLNPGKDGNPNSLLQTAVTAGGALTALIFSLGHVSGGHLNPAVTLCIMIVRAIPFGIGVLYWIAQLLGSLAAAGLYMMTLPAATTLTASSVGMEPALDDGRAFFVQLMVSGLLCWVVLATGVDSHGGEPRNFLAALPIGIAVAVGVVVSGPLIGGSMNPAGSFGLILLTGFWAKSWIYLAGPLVAAIVIALMYKFVFMTRTTGLSAMHRIRDRLARN